MRRTALALVVLATLAAGCGDPICSKGTEYDRAERRCVCREPRTWTGSECVWPSDAGVADAGDREAGAEDAGARDAAPLDACVEVELFRDADGDGFGSPAEMRSTCGEVPAGYVTNADDCDDGCFDCKPGGVETCDGRDEDCDGRPDGDDLCEFGLTCIDAVCTAIPIYRNHVHIRPRTGGAVSGVWVGGTSSGEVVALVSHTGQVDVGTTLLNPGSGTTVSLLRSTTQAR